MAKNNNQNIGQQSSIGSKNTTTNYDASGEVLEVEEPIDLCYLCWKMEAALANPFKCKNGSFRYQRQVTQSIRDDAKAMDYKFLYCGEVGYNMLNDPPTPLMSKTESFRPSEFPLAHYRSIYQEYRNLNNLGDPVGSYLFQHIGFEMFNPLVTKTALENTLTFYPTDNSVKNTYRTLNPIVAKDRFPNGRGLFRIPDVIRKKDWFLLGKEGYHPNNLDMVIEVKFPGDSLSEAQRKAYIVIAGNDATKFRLMTIELCKWRRRGGKEEEEMMEKTKADPRFESIKATNSANVNMRLKLEEQIKAEYETMSKLITKWVKQQEIKYRRPQILGKDTHNFDVALEQCEQYLKRHEEVINAPFMIVGGGIVVTASFTPLVTTMSTTAAETLTTQVVYRGTSKVLEFPFKKTAAAVATTSFRAAANNKYSNVYILEPNGQLTYYENFDERILAQYLDDRLIEKDYFYEQNYIKNKGLVLYDVVDDSPMVRANKEGVFAHETRNYRIHLYPPRQQFYYYFKPGDQPTK